MSQAPPIPMVWTLNQQTAMLRMASTAAQSSVGCALQTLFMLNMVDTSKSPALAEALNATEELERVINELHRYNLHFVQLIEALHTPKR
jgi:hypothetical protein